jgi:PAS domain S-box-containing protein
MVICNNNTFILRETALTDEKTTEQLLQEIEKLQAMVAALEQGNNEHARAEEAYRTLVDQSMQGMAILQDGRVVFTNPQNAKALGCTKEELLTMSLSELLVLFHPDDRECVMANWNDRSAGRFPSQRREYRIIQKDGTVRWMEAITNPIEYQGRPAIQVTSSDITERRYAEEMLARERQAFQIIAEASVSAEGISDLCRQILQGLVEILGFDIGSIRLYDEQEHILDPVALVGLSEESIQEIAPPQPLDNPYYLGAHTARTREPIFAPDVCLHPIYQTHSERIDDLGARAIISWPVLGTGQNLMGAIQMMSYQPKLITEGECAFFESVATMFATALERKQSEQALRASEERYRTLFEASPEAVALVDTNGTILDCNDATEAISGLPRESIIGRPFTALGLLSEENLPGYLALLQQLSEGDATTMGPIEVEVVRADRGVRWLEAFVAPIKRDTVVIAIQIITRDITEHKLAEDALRTSEARYRALAETSPAGIWQIDREGDTVYANPAMLSLLEVAHIEELAGSKYDIFLIPEDAEERERVHMLREKGIASSYDARLLGKRGGERIVMVFGAPILSSDGVLRGTIASLLDITERRRMEEEVRVSEERYRALAETSPTGIWQVDPAGITLYANPAMCALLGVKSVEEIGEKSESPFFTPDSLEKIEIELGKRMEGHSSTYEAEMVRRDGERRSVVVSGAPVTAEDGTLKYTIASFIDVTDLIQIEIALRESEERFRQLAENVMDAFWIGAPYPGDDRQIYYVNPAFERIFGVSSAAIIEADSYWEEILHPEDRDRVVASLERFLQGEVGYNIEYRINHADRGIRWILARAKLIQDEHGKAIRTVGTAQDITERKQAEEELRSRASQLTLINLVASQIAAVLDLDTLMAQAAELTNATFGYQHVGLFLLDPEEEELVMRARAGDYAARFPTDHRLKLGHGMVGWVAQHGKTLLANDVSLEPRYTNPFLPEEIIRSELSVPIRVGGRVLGVFDVQSQQTEAFDEMDKLVIETLANELATAIQNARLYREVQRHAGELERRVDERTAELQAAYEDLQALSRVRDEFVANVSHELRTPITNLVLYHHLLTERPEKQTQYLATLQRETERLENIVEDLLYLSRLEQGEILLSLAPVDLNALVETYVADRSALATMKELTLGLEKATELPIIHGDQVLLERVLGSLLNNSLSYTPPGGHITITTQSRERDGRNWIGFIVRNNGPSIPPDEIPRLFERFFRGKMARQAGVPGTGLGLAITKEIIERHGGEVEVESGLDGPEQGVAFSVWLPVEEE